MNDYQTMYLIILLLVIIIGFVPDKWFPQAGNKSFKTDHLKKRGD